MKTKQFSIILLIILISSIAIYVFFNYQPKIPRVCFEENCFEVEIAETQSEKAEGLMFREFLKEDKGMLFVYNEEGIYSFWMKNTLIPLDIIWVNAEGKVVYIEYEAQPCGETCDSLNPQENAQFVLEINGGIVGKLNITVGDGVNFYNVE